MQQGDIKLFQTPDDGEISVINGITEMSGGLATASYLSMFGGSEDDDGSQDNVDEWWGNIIETEPARKYRSETQNLLQAIPATVGNLRRVEDAARRDLSWMIDEKVASEIFVVASMPRLNVVQINIQIGAFGNESNFEFVENWIAQ